MDYSMSNKLLKQIELSDAFMESVAQSIRDKIVLELGKEVRQRILSRYQGRELSKKIDNLIESELKRAVDSTVRNSIAIDKAYFNKRLEEYVDDAIRANKLISIVNKLSDSKLDKLEQLLTIL